MNLRKLSHQVSDREVDRLFAAFEFARKMQRPLQWLISLRPAGLRSMSRVERCDALVRARQRLTIELSRAGVEAVFAWVREADRSGLCEHLHVALFMPPEAVRKVLDRLGRVWSFADREITLVRWKDAETTLGANGRRQSLAGYLAKSMSPERAAADNLQRSVRGMGALLGKRAGCTRNLDARARAARNDVDLANVIEVDFTGRSDRVTQLAA